MSETCKHEWDLDECPDCSNLPTRADLRARVAELTDELATARRAFDAVHDASGLGFPSWQPGQSPMANAAEVVKLIDSLRSRLEVAKETSDNA